jgi:hypothetical protein
MSRIETDHEFYGYKMVQNPSNAKLALYVGAIDADILRHVVSVDNAVKWDPASNVWRSKGRNRTIEEAHWKSIQDFLSSSNLERILPSAIVISVEETAFSFSPFAKLPPMASVSPGVLTIKGRYSVTSAGDVTPVPEADRTAWVLDGQHRITAFRHWSMPDPYPVNVIIIQAWTGPDYEDVMRHQTYELNMGRPLSEDFKAAIREQYDQQVGHKEYKRQIALSWIRKNLENRGNVFAPKLIVGAAKLRTPYVITLSFLESLIQTAYDHDAYLRNTFTLEKITTAEVNAFAKYLYDFFEGVRLSIGLINPTTKGTIGTSPEVNKALDYWDIATTTSHKQRILHNVGLKGLVRGLLHDVMRSSNPPASPQEVAKLLDHMRGIPWHDIGLQSKKDDWVVALADALSAMYISKGTHTASKKYTMILTKKDKAGNPIDTFNLTCHGW